MPQFKCAPGAVTKEGCGETECFSASSRKRAKEENKLKYIFVYFDMLFVSLLSMYKKHFIYEVL